LKLGIYTFAQIQKKSRTFPQNESSLFAQTTYTRLRTEVAKNELFNFFGFFG